MIRPLLAANWKMNKTRREADQFCDDLLTALSEKQLRHVMIAPQFPLLQNLCERIGSRFPVAAQNCHYESGGAFTAEVSPDLLLEIGIQWVIIGHSERRHLFGESQELVARRLSGALAKGMNVIYCIGEKLDEREEGKTFQVLDAQIAVLSDLGEGLDRTVLAYEPVWAIGTGKVAGTEQIGEVHGYLRSRFPTPPLLYGGSVKPENIDSIASLENVDGALIGGAGLDVKTFSAIVNRALEIKGV